MNNCIEINDGIIVPPPFATVIAASNAIPGTLDAQGRFVAHYSAKALFEKMVAANMIPPLVSPVSAYKSKGAFAPWEHQKWMMELMVSHTRAYNLADMGAGKTNSTLWAFDLLKSMGFVDKLLVITPLSTVDAVWVRDSQNATPHLTIGTLLGSKAKRTKVIVEDRHDILVINHDGCKVVERPLIDWCKSHKVMTVVDEATAIAKYDTQRSKTIQHIFGASKRRYVMTATPVVQSLLKAHGLLVAIGNNTDFPRAFTHFKQEYFVPEGLQRWVPKMSSFGKIQAMMSPAIRLNTRDLIDLPENVVMHRWPEMTPEQRTAFEQMQETLVYEHDPTQVITAMNAAIQLNKLVQIACGILMGNDAVVSLVPKHKLETMVEVIDEAQGKVIIFAPYTAVIDLIKKHLEDQFGEGSVAVIDGRTPGSKRGGIIAQFQEPDNQLRYIVAHPKAASHGITATEADTTLWFAPTFSAESFVQANQRIDRPGQKRTTRTVLMASTDMEKAIYQSLLDKRDTNLEFVEIYNKMLTTAAQTASTKGAKRK